MYISSLFFPLLVMISLPSNMHTVTTLACADAAEPLLDGNVDKVMIIPYFPQQISLLFE